MFFFVVSCLIFAMYLLLCLRLKGSLQVDYCTYCFVLFFKWYFYFFVTNFVLHFFFASMNTLFVFNVQRGFGRKWWFFKKIFNLMN